MSTNQSADACLEIRSKLFEPSTLNTESVITLDDARRLIFARKHTSPRRLLSPGPTSKEIKSLFTLCAAAPDHGLLVPWRFVVIPTSERYQLSQVYVKALLDRTPDATDNQINNAREKAYRSPFLAIAISQIVQSEKNIPMQELLISMGAAIQNMLIGAKALGFESGLTSGRSMNSEHLRSLLSLEQHESAICCINIGTADKAKIRARVRPAMSDFVSTLGKESTPDSSSLTG